MNLFVYLFVYCAHKFVVVCDVTLSLTDSNTKVIPSRELQSTNNKILLLTIKHYIEEIKQCIDDI